MSTIELTTIESIDQKYFAILHKIHNKNDKDKESLRHSLIASCIQNSEEGNF